MFMQWFDLGLVLNNHLINDILREKSILMSCKDVGPYVSSSHFLQPCTLRNEHIVLKIAHTILYFVQFSKKCCILCFNVDKSFTTKVLKNSKTLIHSYIYTHTQPTEQAANIKRFYAEMMDVRW